MCTPCGEARCEQFSLIVWDNINHMYIVTQWVGTSKQYAMSIILPMSQVLSHEHKICIYEFFFYPALDLIVLQNCVNININQKRICELAEGRHNL